MGTLQVPIEKLEGICTDGKTPNTGKNGGLGEQLWREIATEVALESVEKNVCELVILKSNIKGFLVYISFLDCLNIFLSRCLFLSTNDVRKNGRRQFFTTSMRFLNKQHV